MSSRMVIALHEVSLAIKRVQHRHHRALDQGLEALGTTLVQWDALRHIAHEPGSSAHQLALATFQTDQSFGTLANRLADQGLITRATGSGRAIRHHLSPAGEKLLRGGQKVFDAVITRSFSALTGREREVLHGLLTRVLETPLIAR